MTKDDAYLAGVLDARANVHAAITGGENVSVRVSISSQDWVFLESIYDLSGCLGRIANIRRQGRPLSYSWVVESRYDLAQLVKKIKPHVLIKVRQLDLVDESLGLGGGKHGNPAGYARLLAIRDELKVGP